MTVKVHTIKNNVTSYSVHVNDQWTTCTHLNVYVRTYTCTQFVHNKLVYYTISTDQLGRIRVTNYP